MVALTLLPIFKYETSRNLDRSLYIWLSELTPSYKQTVSIKFEEACLYKRIQSSGLEDVLGGGTLGGSVVAFGGGSVVSFEMLSTVDWDVLVLSCEGFDDDDFDMFEDEGFDDDFVVVEEEGFDTISDSVKSSSRGG